MVSIVRSLAWELVCIRVLPTALDSGAGDALCEFCMGEPWEPLYTDDLVLMEDTQEKYISKLNAWKADKESYGLRANMKKTEFLVSGVGHDVLQKSGK